MSCIALLSLPYVSVPRLLTHPHLYPSLFWFAPFPLNHPLLFYPHPIKMLLTPTSSSSSNRRVVHPKFLILLQSKHWSPLFPFPFSPTFCHPMKILPPHCCQIPIDPSNENPFASFPLPPPKQTQPCHIQLKTCSRPLHLLPLPAHKKKITMVLQDRSVHARLGVRGHREEAGR